MKKFFSLFFLIMRPLVCLVFFIMAENGYGKTYHVAATGNNSDPGTYDAPFSTIRKAAEVMSAGDTCYIHAGTYYETIRPARSGTEGNPIVFTAYLNDEVVVHGGMPLAGWTNHKGNIYKIAVSQSVKELFVNRQYMLWARHPNMPYDPEKGFDMCRPTLGTANPPASVDWTGVTVFKSINKEGWWNTVSRENKFVLLPQDLANGGWLMGVPGLIDSEGEWCWKDGTLYLWPVGSGNPDDLLVEAKVRDTGFDLTDRNYINLRNLTVFGATINMNGATHCIVDSCKALYVGSQFNTATFHSVDWDNCSPMSADLQGKGIMLGGSNNILRNCEIAHSWGNCVSVRGSHNKVINCDIYDADWQGWECAVLAMNGGGHVVRGNKLHDAQRSVLLCTNKYGLNPPTEPWFIESNEIYNAGLAKTDNGLIYCFLTDGVGSVIAYNWIHDNFNGYNTTLHSGAGIYVDNYSSNFIMHHNVIWNVMNGHSAAGIRANNPESAIYSYGFWTNSHQIYNNTFLNCRSPVNSPDNDWNGTTGRPYWADTKLYNNILLKTVTFGPAMTGNNYSGANPLFSDTANHDFRLLSGSPCIDAGRVIPGITDDYSGASPDIGAYESEGVYWKPGMTPDSLLTYSFSRNILPFIIYPNPASNILNLQAPEPINLLEIYNLNGILVLQKQKPEMQLKISGLKNGLYIIMAFAGQIKYMQKFIVSSCDQ